jgi:hypothetical protein
MKRFTLPAVAVAALLFQAACTTSMDVLGTGGAGGSDAGSGCVVHPGAGGGDGGLVPDDGGFPGDGNATPPPPPLDGSVVLPDDASAPPPPLDAGIVIDGG